MIIQPLVSVLMTAYNREKYIAEAIESVIVSTYNNFELIIVDDRSSDLTVSIIQSFRDNRIKFFVNENNLGDYPNRNKAVSYANGEYFIFVDSDDKIFPDTLEYLMMSMTASPEASIGMLCRDTSLENMVLKTTDVIQHHFFKNHILTIGPGGTILKTSFFKDIGKYPTQYGPANDMYFNLKAASLGNIKFLCKEFLFYRIHEGQESNNKLRYIYYNYNYFKNALENLDLKLSKKQVDILLKKNKRRVVINTIRILLQEKSIKNVFIIINKTNFTLKDLFQAIFN